MPGKWHTFPYFLSFLLWLQFTGIQGFFLTWSVPQNSFWTNNARIGREKVSGVYKKSVSVTGRVFVTMLGYPSKCERKGITHSCTLAFACWLVGGISQTGCGTSPWLVSCCVTNVKNKKNLQLNDKIQNFVDESGAAEETDNDDEDIEIQIIQRRNDIGNAIEAEPICGISADRVFSKRIVGGQEAQFGQFPWQAYIKIHSYQCGGVLVSKKFVATAAHCILLAKLNSIVVFLGELDTQDTGKVKELAPAELHRVKKKIFHPNFQYKTTQPDRYDLALLELITEAGTNFHISPICLPDESIKLTGRDAVVAGWGKVSPISESMGTNILRSVTVPILDISECMTWHKQRQISVELHKEMMCAGNENGKHDACLGDSGGPLITLENGKVKIGEMRRMGPT